MKLYIWAVFRILVCVFIRIWVVSGSLNGLPFLCLLYAGVVFGPGICWVLASQAFPSGLQWFHWFTDICISISYVPTIHLSIFSPPEHDLGGLGLELFCLDVSINPSAFSVGQNIHFKSCIMAGGLGD